MISELEQSKTINTTIDEFSWDVVEKEQAKLKNKKHLKNLTTLDLGFSKEESKLFEDSISRLLLNPQKGSIIDGTIISLNEKTAVVNINCREDAYIDLSKEKDEYLDYIVPGNIIKVKVLNSDREKSFINLSYTQAVYQTKRDDIFNSIGKKIAYMGEIKSLVPGGYSVLIDEVETFMPGSLAGVNKLHDFSVMLGKSVLVMAVNFERENIVVSHRDYLHTLIPGKIEEIKSDIKSKYSGFVTGTTPYGIFCEFSDCLTGMILAADLDDATKLAFDSKSIKPGNNLEFYIKEIINTKKIILTQVMKADPWDSISDKYKVPCTVRGRVTSSKDYGIFIEIEPGISGLLHHSEFDGVKLDVGSSIDVKIIRLDTTNKKIVLSLK